MLRAVAIAVLLAVPIPVTAASLPICARGEPRVTCVYDGDTFWWRGEKIRAEEYDAPELGGFLCHRTGPLAKPSRAKLAELLGRGDVALALHGRSFNRRLALVTIGGVPLAQLMIGAGLGRLYVPHERPWCG